MYEAFWLPAFESDFDPDEVLGAGGAWLRDAEFPGGPVIALHAAKMRDNRPSLASLASRFPVVAPTTGNRGFGGSHAVLAVWPSKRSMEVAKEMASPNGGLCVIPYLDKEWRSWIAAHRAIDLLKPNDEPEMLDLPAEVRKTLDSIILFDGHNGFGSAEGKIDAIRNLRAMVADGHRPTPADVEAYAHASTDVIRGGGANLRSYYEGILARKKFRDYRGRSI